MRWDLRPVLRVVCGAAWVEWGAPWVVSVWVVVWVPVRGLWECLVVRVVWALLPLRRCIKEGLERVVPTGACVPLVCVLRVACVLCVPAGAAVRLERNILMYMCVGLEDLDWYSDN